MARIQTEEIQGKALDFALLTKIISFLKPYKIPTIGALVLTVTTAFLGPLRPYLIKEAVDTSIASGDTDGLFLFGLQLLGLLVAQGLTQYGTSLLMQWVGQKTIFDLRQRVFTKLQELNLRYYDTNPIGRLITRLTGDIEVLNEVFSSGLVMIISNILMIVWIVYFMLKTSVALTLITIIVLPLLFIATAIFRRYVREQFIEVRKQVARMNTFLNEFITGISIVQLFSQEKRLHKEFDEINQEHTTAQIRSVHYYAVFFPVVELLGTVAIALTLWYAAGSILDKTMTVGIIIAFVQYVEMFFRPIRELSERYNTLQNAMVSSERIFALLDDDAIIPDMPNAIEMPPLSSTIEFKNVSFSYDGEKIALKNVSFTVEHGQTVAIVGATGAGKSTLMNILCRFYEFQEGDIFIDGKSIRSYAQHSLRRRIAIVLQDVFLFSRSVQENISLGDPTITEADCIAAAEAVGASEFINRLPEGYNTQVMERGATLSVGQRQLISFARALASKPDLLILDEATSNIDTATEQQIEAALETLFKGRTSIVIAHRISTIRRADKIIVLHKGEVREMGNHDQLMEQNGIYARYFRLQYKQEALQSATLV